ncbi:hypothetical protein PHET_11951 [Paragonimus heterotremus]|uniref:Uncharacterized protein n=1 Tax=Paragonimus heterotremus TaxID=100268 RepID=A0A8J4T0M0_9TREM|nr:hypothetical protein PHET_11951 [Paragonimus heterotremus]
MAYTMGVIMPFKADVMQIACTTYIGFAYFEKMKDFQRDFQFNELTTPPTHLSVSYLSNVSYSKGTIY